MAKTKKPEDYIYKVTTWNSKTPDDRYVGYINWQYLHPSIQSIFEGNKRTKVARRVIKRPDRSHHVVEVKRMVTEKHGSLH